MRHDIERSFVITLGCLMGLSPMAIDMYLPGLPGIGAELGATPGAVQQTMSVYLICFAIPQLIFGPLSDSFGRRRVMIAGLSVFTLGSVLCATAESITSLILFRGVQGIGAAAIMVTVPALLRDKASGAEFARVMGVIMMIMGGAPLVAPTIGGMILLLGSWRMIFLVLAVLSFSAGIYFYFRISETLGPDNRIKYELGGAIRNYQRLLVERDVLFHMLCAAFAIAGMLGFLAASPSVYIEYYGISEQLYGLLFAVNVAAMIAVTAIGNRWVSRLGSRKMLAAAMLLITVACVILISLVGDESPPLMAVVVAVMFFIGTAGLINANSMALVLERFGHISGSVSALAGTLRFGVGALAPVMIALVYDGTAFALMTVMAGCGLLSVLSFGLAYRPNV